MDEDRSRKTGLHYNPTFIRVKKRWNSSIPYIGKLSMVEVLIDKVVHFQKENRNEYFA